MKVVQSTQQCKTTALSSSDSVTPRFHLIYDLYDTNAATTEIVYNLLQVMDASLVLQSAQS